MRALSTLALAALLSTPLAACQRTVDDDTGSTTDDTGSTTDDTGAGDDDDTGGGGDDDTGETGTVEPTDCVAVYVPSDEFPNLSSNDEDVYTITDTKPASYGDSGLDDLIAEIGKLEGEEPEALGTEITVSGAVVSLVEFTTETTARFHLMDGNDAYLYARDMPIASLPGGVAPVPGQKLSFTATKGQQYFDTAQLSDMKDAVLDDDSPVDVWIADYGDTAVTDVPIGQPIRIYGRVGEKAECGSTRWCYPIIRDTDTIELRMRKNYPNQDESGIPEGQCIEVIAPRGEFGGNPQVQPENWDWVRRDY